VGGGRPTRRATRIGAVRIRPRENGESIMWWELGCIGVVLHGVCGGSLGQEGLLAVSLHAVELGLPLRDSDVFLKVSNFLVFVWGVGAAGTRMITRAVLRKRLAGRITRIAAAVRDDDRAVRHVRARAQVLSALRTWGRTQFLPRIKGGLQGIGARWCGHQGWEDRVVRRILTRVLGNPSKMRSKGDIEQIAVNVSISLDKLLNTSKANIHVGLNRERKKGDFGLDSIQDLDQNMHVMTVKWGSATKNVKHDGERLNNISHIEKIDNCFERKSIQLGKVLSNGCTLRKNAINHGDVDNLEREYAMKIGL
jgi:hypothetical protein